MDKFDGRSYFGLWKHKMFGQMEILGLDLVLTDYAALASEADKGIDGSET